METIAKVADTGITKCVDMLIEKVMKELPYLCCYKSYAADFESKKDDLKAAVESVDMKIREAQKRNETQIDPIVKHWLEDANKFIQQETTPNKWSSRYSMAKDLERMTQEIPTMMEKAVNFSQVAHAAEHPGMKFYSVEFTPFKSRGSNLEQLRKELKDGSKCRVGLQAMGGSGKTVMAKAIGKELEDSKEFDKVIFIEVPNPLDEKKIRDEIEKKLDLKMEDEEKKNLTQAEQIWIRITNGGNVLIILDDVWERIDLERIGIQHGIHNKGRCCVLLTTRERRVCSSMGCEEIIELEALLEEDAVDLFLHHASKSGKDCPYKSKLLATKIVKKCGKLPVIVVAVAKAFKNWEPNEWEDAFEAMGKDSPFNGNPDDEVKKFYNSMKISFKNLDPVAHELILLCSIFPRAREIPLELLSRIAIGLGLCENVERYCRARSEVLLIKTKLISSALLMPAPEGCVRMHDVIREVAHQIANEKIQEILDTKIELKKNVKYSSWITNDFSKHFEGKNLEVLLAWVNANVSLEVPDTFFEGMKQLRVLFLHFELKFGGRMSSSLPKSIQSLENIQTLSLKNWDLGDISLLQNLKNLQSFELTNCSIFELPNGFDKLEKLKFLSLASCSIKGNNPFEVIGRCLKLEVLYYVSNDENPNRNAEPSKIVDLQKFEIYHIGAYSYWSRNFLVDASKKNYFNSRNLKGVLSESTIKSLATRAEILELIECEETNLVPDMVHPKEDGGMNDLNKLFLVSSPTMQCLINTNGIQRDKIIFSNLVELRLDGMCVKELCHGDFPKDFLKQLEKIVLYQCDKLEGTLFKGNLDLSDLKSVLLDNCSITYLFHPSTAQSLKLLEHLSIKGCSKLKCLISDDDGRLKEHKEDDQQDPNQKNARSMFPKLKFLKVEECQELEFVLPICPCKELETVEIWHCNELKYIFGQCLEEGGLYQMEKETTLPLLQEIDIRYAPKFINICSEYYLPQPPQVQKSWNPLCCLSSKSSSAISMDKPYLSEANRLDHAQDEKGKKQVKWLHRAEISKAQSIPLYQFNLKKIKMTRCTELTSSLFTISIASSLKLLETLKVHGCDKLEHIVTEEGPNSHSGMNVDSIFPNLQKVSVRECQNLESVFPAFYSKGTKSLKTVMIRRAEKMKHVFGKCDADRNHNIQSELNLPALKDLTLEDVPGMMSICAENYYVEVLHLEEITLEGFLQLPKTFTDFLGGHKRQGDLSRRKRGKALSNLQDYPDDSRGIHVAPKNILSCRNLSGLLLDGCKQVKFIFSASTMRSMPELKLLCLVDCEDLESIIEDGEENDEHHQECFQKLRFIIVRSCKKLKYLFSISTCPKLARLLMLYIEEAPELKQVLKTKQGLVIKDVLPNLDILCLKNLPSVDQGIDVQTVKLHHVRDCNNVPSADVSSSELYEYLQVSLPQQKMNFSDDDYEEAAEGFISNLAKMRKGEEAEEDKTRSKQNNITPDNIETSRNEIMEEQLPPSNAAVTSSSSKSDMNKEVSKEIVRKYSTAFKKIKNLSRFTKAIQNTKTSSNEIVEEHVSPSNTASTPTTNEIMEDQLPTKELCEKKSMGDQEVLGEGTSLNEHPQSIKSANEIVEEKVSRTPPSISDKHLEEPFGEAPSSERYGKASSSSSKSRGMEPMVDDQQELGEGGSSNNNNNEIIPERVEDPTHEFSPPPPRPPFVTEMTFASDNLVHKGSSSTHSELTISNLGASASTKKDPLISPPTPKKHHIATSTADTEQKSSQSDLISECPQLESMITGETFTDEEKIKFEEHDLIKLFQMMKKEGADRETDLSYVTKLIADLQHNQEVSKALSDLEASLKMSLSEIASSEESRLRLFNALNILSSHCSEDGAPSHVLQATIHSLQQEIQTILSSFNWAYATNDTFTKLEQKKKLMIDQRSKQEKDARTLLYEISNTKISIAEAQLNEAELKEKISKLQEEIGEYQRRLLLLQEQEKKSVSETIGLEMEFLATENERSHMEEDQMKARQQLETLKAKWSYCLAKLKKATMLLGVHLKQKL